MRCPAAAVAAHVGDPRHIHLSPSRLVLPPPAGFNYTGGPWSLFKGKPGQTYTLYTDAKAVKLTSLFGACAALLCPVMPC